MWRGILRQTERKRGKQSVKGKRGRRRSSIFTAVDFQSDNFLSMPKLKRDFCKNATFLNLVVWFGIEHKGVIKLMYCIWLLILWCQYSVCECKSIYCKDDEARQTYSVRRFRKGVKVKGRTTKYMRFRMWFLILLFKFAAETYWIWLCNGIDVVATADFPFESLPCNT